MEAATDVVVTTVRGDVEIDVAATDLIDVHQARTLVECKNWTRRVSRSVVHSFRTVVSDSGAHVGLIISKAGFQPGAVAAAVSTNLRLLSWEDFQELYLDRWYDHHFRSTIDAASDALAEYTEPLNGRVERPEQRLSATSRVRYASLVHQYWGTALFARVLTHLDHRMVLPLRRSQYARLGLSDSILDAGTYGALLAALCNELEAGTAAIDAVFGRRV